MEFGRHELTVGSFHTSTNL